LTIPAALAGLDNDAVTLNVVVGCMDWHERLEGQ